MTNAHNPLAGVSLVRNAHGLLDLTLPDGSQHEAVVPVRAFPLSDAEGAFSLVGSDGKERLWVPDPQHLPDAVRSLVQDELRQRTFMPEIQALKAVSTFNTPSTWTVDTDRGPHEFVLNGEEDIRRLPDGRLLITDMHGIAHIIVRPAHLDRRSRKLLERFL
jgi:Domain of unknown function (DUF1854)